MGIDVAYIVRPGDRNAELRYSLRSLINVPHRDVWIIGHRPAWCVNVKHIFVPQLDPRSHKYENATALMTALSERGPGTFALMNDDFFCLRPVGHWPPAAHRGPLLDLAESRPGSYGMLLRATAALLREAGQPDPLAYTLHMPMVMERDALAFALEYGLRRRPAGDQLSWRSLYGNLMRIGGEQRVDVKVAEDGTLPDDPWISTTDTSFKYMRVGGVIRRELAAPSLYETAMIGE